MSEASLEQEATGIVIAFRSALKTGVEDPIKLAAHMLADLELNGADQELLQITFEAITEEMQRHVHQQLEDLLQQAGVEPAAVEWARRAASGEAG